MRGVMPDQLVCTKCWKWYDGRTLCPTCREPLVSPDPGKPLPELEAPPVATPVDASPAWRAGGEVPALAGEAFVEAPLPRMSGYPTGTPVSPPTRLQVKHYLVDDPVAGVAALGPLAARIAHTTPAPGGTPALLDRLAQPVTPPPAGPPPSTPTPDRRPSVSPRVPLSPRPPGPPPRGLVAHHRRRPGRSVHPARRPGPRPRWDRAALPVVASRSHRARVRAAWGPTLRPPLPAAPRRCRWAGTPASHWAAHSPRRLPRRIRRHRDSRCRCRVRSRPRRHRPRTRPPGAPPSGPLTARPHRLPHRPQRLLRRPQRLPHRPQRLPVAPGTARAGVGRGGCPGRLASARARRAGRPRSRPRRGRRRAGGAAAGRDAARVAAGGSLLGTARRLPAPPPAPRRRSIRQHPPSVPNPCPHPRRPRPQRHRHRRAPRPRPTRPGSCPLCWSPSW